MNKELFASMRAQMTPSPRARAALAEKLEQRPAAKPVPWGRYAAVAACAALVLCIYPAYTALTGSTDPKPHDYVTVEGSSNTELTKSMAEEAVTGQGSDQGDHDIAMTSEELFEAMEEAGFSTADIDAYQAMGYRMTWTLWHRYSKDTDLSAFVAYTKENQAWIDEIIAAYGSGGEEAPNTGDLPGGAYVGDMPTQPGVDSYQLLMAHFGDTLPDWYGGAYVDKGGALMVLLVDEKDPGDKTLELEVLEAVGRTAQVGFSGVKYSRNELDRLNRELSTLMDGKGLSAGWGIYEDQNRIVLDFYELPSEELLTELSRIDPDGDAILVRVIEGGSPVTDELVKGPAPVDTVGEEDDGFDVVHRLPGGVTVPDDEDLIATEPEVEDLPQSKKPAVEEAVPVQTENGD